MKYISNLRRFALAFGCALIISSILHAETADGLRKRLATASSSIKDLSGTMVVKPANKKDAAEISKGILEFLDYGFREASIAYKQPDKFRAQGKTKGIDVAYVLNGNKQQYTAPSIMLKKTEDMSRKIAKKQSTLDLGFASDSLWHNNRVKLISERKGVIELQLVPNGTKDKRKELIWVDSKSLKVVKRERYSGSGKMKSRQIYKNHKIMDKMPVAMEVDIYSADGGFAGSILYKNIKVNTKLSDSLFAIK
jgi:outer membrane lipoprotein-sorting protein